MRRVVVTGMGLVTPLGVGVDHVWKRLTAGESGVSRITKFNTDDLAAKIAGQVPRGTGAGEFNVDACVEPKEQKKMDEFIHFAMGAADEAIARRAMHLAGLLYAEFRREPEVGRRPKGDPEQRAAKVSREIVPDKLLRQRPVAEGHDGAHPARRHENFSSGDPGAPAHRAQEAGE